MIKEKMELSSYYFMDVPLFFKVIESIKSAK
jgi:hypothetical protein